MSAIVYQNILKAPKPKNHQFLNLATYYNFFYRLMEYPLNMFEWKELPETCNERFLELQLCTKGMCAYFEDEVIGPLVLPVSISGNLDVYGEPIQYRAYAANGYQKNLDKSNSVLIYNNYLHQPTMDTVALFAERLANLQRSIDVNVSAQKTPTVIVCDEQQQLTMQNLFRKVQDNEVVIFGKKNLDLEGISTFNPRAEFVGDQLSALQTMYWNQAMTFFGVETSPSEKKERLNVPEVDVAMGSAQAQRFIFLNPRQQAAEAINQMFGTNLQVEYREITRNPGMSTEGWDDLPIEEEGGESDG